MLRRQGAALGALGQLLDENAATAPHGFGARVLQRRLQGLDGLANTPALDDEVEAGSCQRGEHGEDGDDHHQLDGSEAFGARASLRPGR